MKDTMPDLAAYVRERYAAMAPEERFLLGNRMFDDAGRAETQAICGSVIGRGAFEPRGSNQAALIQIGHLNDGSASGFTTMPESAVELPYVPLPQTCP